MEGFKTINGDITAEQIIEKSRFIAHIARVRDQAETEKHRSRVKRDYPDARHYVFAYRLAEGRQEKASDDGEPQGTGGRPVLNLLQHYGVWNVQIVVVRYFGGILLGTGGLTRAYSTTTRLALEKAQITVLLPHLLCRLEIPYPVYEKLKYGISRKGWSINSEHFRDNVEIEILIPQEEADTFKNWLDDLTGRRVSMNEMGIVYRAAEN